MAEPVTFSAFQRFIREHYHERDAARGTPATFMWLIEEIGELATALHHHPASSPDLAEEFADVLGWLATLANMHGVDLEEAVRAKYLSKDDPSRHKS